jgi:hypothetical protein
MMETSGFFDILCSNIRKSGGCLVLFPGGIDLPHGFSYRRQVRNIINRNRAVSIIP